jgi:hypothetical protein
VLHRIRHRRFGRHGPHAGQKYLLRQHETPQTNDTKCQPQKRKLFAPIQALFATFKVLTRSQPKNKQYDKIYFKINMSRPVEAKNYATKKIRRNNVSLFKALSGDWKINGTNKTNCMELPVSAD